MTVNIFELATRNRYRFKADNGYVTTEDLWALPLPQLDRIALALKKELGADEESFISEVPKDNTLQQRFDVVIHIIETLLAEKNEAKTKAERAEQRKVLLDALATRQKEELNSLSAEEIKKRIEALDKDAA